MDISKPPDHNDLAAASGIWKWLIFFCGLIGAGGTIEYWLSKRYVTKNELALFQTNCQRHMMDQLEIALLKNNSRLEERMISAVTEAIKRSTDNSVPVRFREE